MALMCHTDNVAVHLMCLRAAAHINVSALVLFNHHGFAGVHEHLRLSVDCQLWYGGLPTMVEETVNFGATKVEASEMLNNDCTMYKGEKASQGEPKPIGSLIKAVHYIKASIHHIKGSLKHGYASIFASIEFEGPKLVQNVAFLGLTICNLGSLHITLGCMV
jgi:hypothetical protein